MAPLIDGYPGVLEFVIESFVLKYISAPADSKTK